MKINKLNLVTPFWIALAVVLCLRGLVSWWVVVLIFTSHIEVWVEL